MTSDELQAFLEAIQAGAGGPLPMVPVEGSSFEHDWSRRAGVFWPLRAAGPHFLDPRSRVVELLEPRVLVCASEPGVKALAPLLERQAQERAPLVVVAPSFPKRLLANLQARHAHGLTCLALVPLDAVDGYGPLARAVCSWTGAKPWDPSPRAQPTLGSAAELCADKTGTFVVPEPRGYAEHPSEHSLVVVGDAALVEIGGETSTEVGANLERAATIVQRLAPIGSYLRPRGPTGEVR